MGGARPALDHLTKKTQTAQVIQRFETCGTCGTARMYTQAAAVQRGSDAEVCSSCTVNKENASKEGWPFLTTVPDQGGSVLTKQSFHIGFVLQMCCCGQENFI